MPNETITFDDLSLAFLYHEKWVRKYKGLPAGYRLELFNGPSLLDGHGVAWRLRVVGGAGHTGTAPHGVG
jgi:hypothetical protein